MPQLTTTRGDVIDFATANVGALTDMDADTGEAITCVFGIEPEPLRTAEAVASLIARLHLKAARLTRPDGSPIWIVGSAVTSLRAPLPGDAEPEVQAVVATSGMTAGVTENPQEARQALDAAGAHL